MGIVVFLAKQMWFSLVIIFLMKSYCLLYMENLNSLRSLMKYKFQIGLFIIM